MAAMRSWVVCLLLIAAAAGSAAQDCPDLFSALTPADAREAVIRDCTGSQLSCGACQGSLVRAITPRLVQSGKVLSSEAWMPASLTTIADSLTACKRDFSVQLLENTNATLSELASLDGCSTDVKAVSQCISAQSGAAASGATAVPRAAASGIGDMAGEVLAEACAAAVSGSANAADCPSPAAAQVVAGVPLSSGGGLVFVPVSDASVLRISAANTRGTTTWRAFCYCDDTWDPVCDGNTRKQYPNACSAKCQNVTSVVSCSALEPLVNQTMAGNTAVFVVDEALVNPSAAAFAGPVPPEASEDSQNFYYYYEDDADDTNDALEIASTLAEAFLAARMGEEVEAVDAVVKAVPAAIQATVSRTNVTAADGPDATAAAPQAAGTGPLAALRNITISRQRLGLLGGRPAAAAAAPERRNVTVATGMATMPAPPSWMATSAPGYSAGVYQRDADRTSRILASLMAAAQEAGKATPPAALAVPRQTFTLPRVGGLASADSNTPAGGLLRSALPAVSNVTARVNGTIVNMTSALDDMMSNATANGTTAALRAFGGLAQNPTSTVALGLGGLLQRLRTAVQQAAADRPAATAFQGITAGSAMNAMSATLDSAMNATMNGTSAGNSTASQRGSMPKRHFMFL